MSDAISWVIMLKLKDGQLEPFRTLMEEMVASTREEPGAEMYEWFLSEDQSTVHIYERYADSDATMVPLGSFGEKFAGRFFGAGDPIGFNVYGSPNAATRDTLTGAGATILGPFGGFS